MNFSQWLLAVALIGRQFTGSNSVAQDKTDDINALKKQIQELDQKVRILERNRELETELSETKHKESPKLIAGRIGQLTLSDELFPLFATAASAKRASSWGAGLNWYLNRNIKVNLDYEDAFPGRQHQG